MVVNGTKHISVVIPCYNEERVIARTLGHLEAFLGPERLDDTEVIVVDNCSMDGTAEAARSTELRNVIVVDRCDRPGKGAAVRSGVEHSSGDIVIVTDADGDYIHNDATPYLETLEAGADIVLASRAHPDARWEFPEELKVYARSRRRLGRIYNLLVRMIFPLTLRDTQTGLKFMRGDIARELFRDLRIERFAYDVELLVRAWRRGMKIVERPLTYNVSAHPTKVGFWDKPQMVVDLFKIRSMCWHERGSR